MSAKKRGRGFTQPHTPGPWKVIANFIYPSNFATAGEGLTSIAKVHLPPRCRLPTGKYAANTALIAAAPELLAACEEIDRACADALSALRESAERSPGMVRAQAAGVLRDRIQSTARAAIAKARGGA